MQWRIASATPFGYGLEAICKTGRTRSCFQTSGDAEVLVLWKLRSRGSHGTLFSCGVCHHIGINPPWHPHPSVAQLACRVRRAPWSSEPNACCFFQGKLASYAGLCLGWRIWNLSWFWDTDGSATAGMSGLVQIFCKLKMYPIQHQDSSLSYLLSTTDNLILLPRKSACSTRVQNCGASTTASWAQAFQ